MRNHTVLVAILAMSVLAHGKSVDASGEASFMLGRSYVSALLLDDQTSFGGTVGFFSTIVGFELGFDYMPTSDFVVPGVSLGASVANVTGNVVVQAPLDAFVPYGTVGYGAMFANASSDLSSDDFLGTFGAFNFGGGVKFYFTENLGVRIDFRRFAIQTDVDDPSLEIPVAGEQISADPDINRFMVGLAVRW